MTTAERGTPMGVELTRRIMRHVVGIYYDFTLEGERRQVVQTAFLFSVVGRWMLMTAGHCISDIRAFRDRGGILRRCRLIDCMGEGAQHIEPVPLSYDEWGRQPEASLACALPSAPTCRSLRQRSAMAPTSL